VMIRRRAIVGPRNRVLRTAHAVVAAVAASVALGAAPRLPAPIEQSTTARAAVLRDITGEASFRAVFDRASATPRLVLLLSPT